MQRESLAETAGLLGQHAVDPVAALADLHVELVLTAHPTEASRRSVLDHQWAITELLDRVEDPRTGRSRRRVLLAELREVLTIWWQTDEVRRARPHVEDEVRRTLYVFESVLYDAVPAVLDELERDLGPLPATPVLEFASWPGGDMDGHPEVGAATVTRTIELHRRAAIRMLRDRVALLARRFSHSERRVTVSDALAASLARDAQELPDARVLRRPHHAWEPLRTKLGFIERRLINMLDVRGGQAGYEQPRPAARRPRADRRKPRLRPCRARIAAAAAAPGRQLRLPPRRAGPAPERDGHRRGRRRAAARLRQRARGGAPGAARRGDRDRERRPAAPPARHRR